MNECWFVCLTHADFEKHLALIAGSHVPVPQNGWMPDTRWKKDLFDGLRGPNISRGILESEYYKARLLRLLCGNNRWFADVVSYSVFKILGIVKNCNDQPVPTSMRLNKMLHMS